jgi:hypothetical protein
MYPSRVTTTSPFPSDLTLTFHDESTSSTNASNPVFDYSAEDPQQTLGTFVNPPPSLSFHFHFDFDLVNCKVCLSNIF